MISRQALGYAIAISHQGIASGMARDRGLNNSDKRLLYGAIAIKRGFSIKQRFDDNAAICGTAAM